MMTPPALALNVPMFAHIDQFAIKPRDPLLHAPPIHFELRFAGPRVPMPPVCREK